MNINQKVAQEVARDLRKKLPEFFDKIGGQQQKKPKLNVRWCLPADQLTLWHKDVEEAVKGECTAEITQELYGLARQAAPVVDTIDLGDGKTGEALMGFVCRLITHADKLSKQCVMIVSPTVTTMIQASGSNLFRVARSDERRGGYVGQLGAHRLFIDNYARDDVPVLIAAPGWFSYEAGLFVYSDDDVDPDYAASFFKDLEHKIDSTKVVQVIRQGSFLLISFLTP